MIPRLVVFSGLPGGGKTTLARLVAQRLGAPMFAKDRIQRVLRDNLPGAEPIHGYHLLLDMADEQLGLGLSVVLDAVFPAPEFREAARAIARRNGAAMRAIFCFCSDEAVWRARMEERVQYVPGWEPVGWAEVERVRGYFQPWPAGEALPVDALEPVERNLARVLEYLEID